ncbi:Tautomerase/MIF superfamily protein, partial [Prunus dulcis]
MVHKHGCHAPDRLYRSTILSALGLGPHASELPKGLALDRCECAYIRHIASSPLVDVGSRNGKDKLGMSSGSGMWCTFNCH